jgi:23S rRNA (guanosine2251-2'-O)-methyltransferase
MNKTNYIYGIHAVLAALQRNPNSIDCILLQQQRHDQRLQEILNLAQKNAISVKTVSREELDKLVNGMVHQGVVASAQLQTYTENDLQDLLDQLQEPPFLLILDGVQDPHNLGACLRSANAAGVHAVIAPKDNAVGMTATVLKVASGAAQATPFIQVTNLARVMRGLKERGIWIFGTSDAAEQSIYQCDLRGALALVCGAEESGMRRITREHCDSLASIPMFGTVSSLNVSVATAVCLFEALRQRRFS